MLHYNWYTAQSETNKMIVLLHGFISDQRTFSSHIEPLTQAAHVLCVDLPGHGQDQSPEEGTHCEFTLFSIHLTL
ncbi:alpha/beta fold hydrolase [Staphylococcus pseudintermedius]|uniref:alpha/beta fold hydrolase n=1 Tax=Staphylococcus pseudintermedius TaxID=283734 RepID=UPI00286D7C51|nr:alpha/beta fold hydrolase [Staphylococcus pseudintermedius]WMZ45132.1 hypothetical protein QS415_11335 [Staphylococcus pseudintermedius]